ncbi:MAG: hypothetical protein LKJ88_07840 [Bacilli bacterium]|jgi:hypothetical protein|nr:hypothetical protein [Bacilli bacterium]
MAEKEKTVTKKASSKTSEKAEKKPIARKNTYDKKAEETKIAETKPEVAPVLEENQVKAEPVEQKPVEKIDEAELAQAAEADKKTEAPAPAPSEMEKNVYEPIPAPSYEGDLCEQELETKRKAFADGMKKSRTQSTITAGVLIVGLIGGFVANAYLPESLKWLVYVIFGVLILFIIVEMVISSRSRKKLYANVDVFVKDAILAVDSYVFTDPDFVQPVVSRNGHIDIPMIGQESHYFETINAVNSRNIVKVEYLNKTLVVAEVAARIPYQTPLDGKDHSKDDPKKRPGESYGIFGKFVSYPLSLKSKASVIILLGGTNACLPTFLDGYGEVKNAALRADYRIWATDENAATEMLTPAIVEILNGFSSDQNMENMFLSINKYGLKIALNYNETVMEVPMEKPVIGTPYVHYKADIKRVKELIKALETVAE